MRWHAWRAETFQVARDSRRPVLLALGPQWCAATAAMRREVYADEVVAALIEERCVPVWVDAERRPDISERYSLGGWPTTAFLAPDGRILGGETYATAERLRALVPRVADAFARQGATLAAGVRPAPPRPPRGGDRPDHGLETWLADHMRARFDDTHGGFGTGVKQLQAPALELALRRGREGDLALAEVLRRTLDAVTGGGLCDTREGGIFRYCAVRDWTAPGTEKLLGVNAAALRLFVEVDDEACHARARDLLAYVRRTLMDRSDETPGFFGSQRADDAYYRAPAGAAAAPPVDRTIYADATAEMARAYTRAAARFDDTSLLAFAVDALERVVAGTYERGGGIAHCADAPSEARGLLSDQVAASAALLDLHAATEREVYRDMAHELMRFTLRHLWDAAAGGFLDRVPAADDIGLLAEPHRPFAVNCEAARVLGRLARVADAPDLRERAVATLAAVAGEARAHGVDAAPYALALRDLADG